ncbi:protein-tyrosine phosphatase [Ruminiclostridium sufflavum DSM 19573]|uniref:protein-tyrosine-phosphatase n=1 Tax=Ruminiclostridium sufflavum DSM 19573 TaxID=1121337 RepID=A0A318XY59_9FIRM|nr:CpsB/CapC family capsule biosynthesis tyrosine phosphatase [Ruminiclostridium sufflavum]PYG87783.1 protein-tyrosine phosphatase [Ruminiclostridium sufflavum DSM 19573]
MIDIHCHLIPNVDDGPSTIENSMEMISEAIKLGITSIITTPHYNKSIYRSDSVPDNFYKLKQSSRSLGVDLLLGYEVFLCTSFYDIISQKRKYTLNKSKYLLFELPFDIMPVDINNTMQKLHSEGLVPIIAHPERNKYFSKDMDKFINLIVPHCLVQLDAASIAGVYGLNVKRFTKRLISQNLVDFIASDAHRPEDYKNWYPKALENVKSWAGEEYCNKVFNSNQNIILNSY